MITKNLIKVNDLVRVKKVGNDLELHNINTCNRKATLKKIGGRKHINLRTGEIVEEKQSTLRGENPRSLYESNLRLYDLVKANTIELWKMLYITLTYKEKIRDIRKIKEDFKSFIKHLRDNVQQFGKIEYICKLELYSDKSGYHIHAILFFNESKDKVYIPPETLAKAWKKGFADIGQPINEREIRLYLTPHLANEVNDKNAKMHNKALLDMELPAGANLYSYSKGIKKPEIWTDNYESVKQYLKENEYTLEKQKIYKNEMQTFRDNNLYYYKEYYTKNTNKEKPKPPRKPI